MRAQTYQANSLSLSAAIISVMRKTKLMKHLEISKIAHININWKVLAKENRGLSV